MGSLVAGGQPRRELSERCLPIAGGAVSGRIEVSAAVARHTMEVAAAVESERPSGHRMRRERCQVGRCQVERCQRSDASGVEPQ